MFLKSNGVKHIRCVPSYHLSSNGAVEQFIQTFRKAIRAGGKPGTTFHQRQINFLLVYRTMLHSTTSVPPCVLFLKKRIEDTIYCMRMSRIMSLHNKWHRNLNMTNIVENRVLYVGQRVLARNYHPGEDWIPGTVIERRNPHSYTVQM